MTPKQKDQACAGAEANPAMTVARDKDGSIIDTRAHGDPATIADLIDVVRELIGAINTQREGIQQLADSVGALAQCVAMVMEEELGTPVPDKPESVETDLDGNPVA